MKFKKIFFLFLILLPQCKFLSKEKGCSQEKQYHFFYNKPTPPESKVVAVSIFRQNKITNPNKFKTYIQGLKAGAKDLPNKLPGWIYRVYTDLSLMTGTDEFSQKFRKIMSEIIPLDHVQVVTYVFPEFLDQPDSILHKQFFGTLARFHASFDENVKYALIRNARNPITKIDVRYIKRWIKSKKKLMLYSCMRSEENKPLAHHFENEKLEKSYYDINFQSYGYKINGVFHKLDIVANLILAGLWATYDGLQAQIWNDILKSLRNKQGNLRIGVDEIVLTDILFNYGYLKHGNNYCIRPKSSFLLTMKNYGYEKEVEIIAKQFNLSAQALIANINGGAAPDWVANKIENNIRILIKNNKNIESLYKNWEKTDRPSIVELLYSRKI